MHYILDYAYFTINKENSMKTRYYPLIILLAVGLSAGRVYADDVNHFGTYTPDQFRDYWYNHGAEISRFTLQQVRYGEIHQGDAVLVFVTEEMNPALQVKADHSDPQNIPVLKLNAVRKFFTGIYPYSIMTSVFTPLDVKTYPLPLKVTASFQEWCGQVYNQMNLIGDEYRVRVHSYFEKEGDRNFKIKNHVPEDAIWTRLRIDPSSLPRGRFSIIPGTVYARLAHRPLKPQKANAVLRPVSAKSLEGNPLVRYEINFPAQQRVLRILFETQFPYRIQQWEESYLDTADKGAKVLTTRATRTHSIMDAYWQHHGNRDRVLLKNLGLGAREMQID
jgi:hypothetical protein